MSYFKIKCALSITQILHILKYYFKQYNNKNITEVIVLDKNIIELLNVIQWKSNIQLIKPQNFEHEHQISSEEEMFFKLKIFSLK